MSNENIFLNVLTITSERPETINDIVDKYVHAENDDEYLLDIDALLMREENQKITPELLRAVNLFNDIQFMASADFNDLAHDLAKSHIESITDRFWQIDKTLTNEVFTSIPGNSAYEKFYWLFTNKYNNDVEYNCRITGFDVHGVNAILNFPDLLYKLSKVVFSEYKDELSFIPLTKEELLNEEQVWVRNNDTSFIITVPTKFGPCLEVVEQLNNLYDDININVVFGNGDIRGEITVNDYGEIFLENKEPTISKAFYLLDALGLFESQGEKLGWTTIHAEEAGLLDRVDE